MKTEMNLKLTNIILRRSIKLIYIRKPMKKLILFLILIISLSCNSEEEKKNLENTTWKFCGDNGAFLPDVFVFNEKYCSVKNDSIFWNNKDSLIGIVDTITLHYGARRLYVKDLRGNVGRYCEQ